MIVPNTGNLFNVPNPIVSIDYRRPKRENDGLFFFKDNLKFGVETRKLKAYYAYDNGVGGCVINSFLAYPPAWDWSTNGLWNAAWGASPVNGEIPVDGVWRTYGFSYNPLTGQALITINNPAHTEVSTAVVGMNFCGWTAIDMTMFSSMDNATSSAVYDTSAAFLDNASFGRITVLPVLLEYFKGEQSGLGVDLAWKTANEQDNMGFILYRSTDAESWKEVTRIDGQNTTGEAHTYTYRDEAPFAGLSFYRLVQVDMNGATTGYPAVKVEMNYSGHELLALYPNPVNEGLLNIKFESERDGLPLTVQIYSLDGQLMHTEAFSLQNGINNLSLNLTDLASGMYIAKVNNGRHTHSEKFSILSGN
jgi:hypothetical protein